MSSSSERPEQRPAAAAAAPAVENGPIKAVPNAPGVYFVEGLYPMKMGPLTLKFTRTMTIVRGPDDALTLINTVRLHEAQEKELLELGNVARVVRLGAFHSRDDAYYAKRFGATVWAMPGHQWKDHPLPDGTDVKFLGKSGSDGCPLPGADVIVFRGVKKEEAALFLRKQKVLVLCDMAMTWAPSGIKGYRGPRETLGMGLMKKMLGLTGAMVTPKDFVKDMSEDGKLSGMRKAFEAMEALPYGIVLSAHGPPCQDAKSKRAAWLKKHHIVLQELPAGNGSKAVPGSDVAAQPAGGAERAK